MTQYLLDTSAIIEGLTGSLAGLRTFIKLCKQVTTGKSAWFTTPLMHYEFNNVMRYKYDPISSHLLFNHLLKLKIKVIKPTVKEKSIARNLAFETNTSYYDASYHILAISRDMIFLTMDNKYYKKARSRGSISLLTKLKF